MRMTRTTQFPAYLSLHVSLHVSMPFQTTVALSVCCSVIRQDGWAATASLSLFNTTVSSMMSRDFAVDSLDLAHALDSGAAIFPLRSDASSGQLDLREEGDYTSTSRSAAALLKRSIADVFRFVDPSTPNGAIGSLPSEESDGNSRWRSTYSLETSADTNGMSDLVRRKVDIVPIDQAAYETIHNEGPAVGAQPATSIKRGAVCKLPIEPRAVIKQVTCRENFQARHESLLPGNLRGGHIMNVETHMQMRLLETLETASAGVGFRCPLDCRDYLNGQPDPDPPLALLELNRLDKKLGRVSRLSRQKSLGSKAQSKARLAQVTKKLTKVWIPMGVARRDVAVYVTNYACPYAFVTQPRALTFHSNIHSMQISSWNLCCTTMALNKSSLI